MHMERERRSHAWRRRAGAAFWSAVSAAIGAYLAVITLGRRGRRHG